ncbi:carbon storage regulator [Paenibacillus sp. USHLN196]|uniref:carbon storage regulator n=1 Tax=Paenibacillus sp. USHLN196 TaxID=3081291 RepID=UPI00301AF848
MGKLSLTRRPGEGIIIDKKIRITVMVINNVPKLVIEAPKDVNIVREEVLTVEEIEICRENGLSLA